MAIDSQIYQSLQESLKAKADFWQSQQKEFFAVAEELFQCVTNNHKILIFGNGGSACDALHFSGELVNRYIKDRRPLSCLALTADSPLITCIGNDFDFASIFSKQIEAHARPGDCVIGISTSGNSANVISGLKMAKSMKLKTIALLGGSGGKIYSERIFDFALNVSASKSTPRIQETHQWILHSLCEYIDFKMPKR